MSSSFTPRALRRFAAFTLLELVVVIGVIALLASLVVGAGRRASDTGKAARARAELIALAAALASYQVAHGDYPRTDDPARLLQSLIGKRGPSDQRLDSRAVIELARFTTADALDPELVDTAVLLDPWEQPYRYAYKTQTPWTNPSYVLYSAGSDQAQTLALMTGGFPDRTAAGNRDNLYGDLP